MTNTTALENGQRQIGEDDIKKAAEEEQREADDAHLRHLNQRVAILRAALDMVHEENHELRAKLVKYESSEASDDEDLQ